MHLCSAARSRPARPGSLRDFREDGVVAQIRDDWTETDQEDAPRFRGGPVRPHVVDRKGCRVAFEREITIASSSNMVAFLACRRMVPKTYLS